MQSYRKTTICLALVFLAGCSSLNRSKTTENGSNSLQIPAPALAKINEAKEYRINPLDMLEISVYMEPDLQKITRVSLDGFVTYPLIGKLNVAGLTVIEAEEKFAKCLSEGYLINPQVTVNIKEYHSKKIIVMGEVKNPGSFEIPQDRGMTILEAIALAGGFSALASADRTKIIRVENGEQKYIEVKVSDIVKRGDKAKDAALKPNDIVFVPERMF